MKTVLGAMIFVLLTLPAFAADYSTMTTEELSKMRGTMQENTSIQERNAFQKEWNARVEKMSEEEKGKYLGTPGADDKGQRKQQALREREQEQALEKERQRERDMLHRGTGGIGSGIGRDRTPSGFQFPSGTGRVGPGRTGAPGMGGRR